MIQITHENMKVSLGIPNPIINIRVVTHTAAKQNFPWFFLCLNLNYVAKIDGSCCFSQNTMLVQN